MNIYAQIFQEIEEGLYAPFPGELENPYSVAPEDINCKEEETLVLA